MVSLAGKSDALERIGECLSPDAPDERCSLEVMEAVMKLLHVARNECTQAQQTEIDDLWRVLKMIYNGATRQEALAASKADCIGGEVLAKAYGQALCYLNPKRADSKACSVEDLENTYKILEAKEAHSNFSQAQNQVIDQLRKAIQDAKGGASVEAAILHVWEDRNNTAQRRLMNTSAAFVGMYPSGGAEAFEQALACLSPSSPEEQCTLEIMESAFRTLDAEMIRQECSQAQEYVIDDLWRLIKMMYNGATRQQALAARQPQEIQNDAVSQEYAKVLRFLNPVSSDSQIASLKDLETSLETLDTAATKAIFSNAQVQVLEQLEKATQAARSGDSVHASIRKIWKQRDDAARTKI